MEYAIQAINLTKKYRSILALDRANINVPKGSIYGLVGPNGAGKTTLMRIFLGSLFPTDGYFAINGKTESDDLDLERKKIGSIIELPALYDTMSAIDNLIARCKLLGISDYIEKSKEILDYVGLGKEGNKKVAKFSLGMKQRLGIGLALLNDPEILILDEPTNGLDPIGIIEIRNILKKLNSQGVTVLISSHILSELSKFATHYGILYRGEVVKEVSLEEVCQNCSDSLKISFESSDTAKFALQILSAEFIENSVQLINDTTIKVLLNNTSVNSSVVAKILVDAGLFMTSIETEKEGFEEYFLKLINQRGRL